MHAPATHRFCGPQDRDRLLPPESTPEYLRLPCLALHAMTKAASNIPQPEQLEHILLRGEQALSSAGGSAVMLGFVICALSNTDRISSMRILWRSSICHFRACTHVSSCDPTMQEAQAIVQWEKTILCTRLHRDGFGYPLDSSKCRSHNGSFRLLRRPECKEGVRRSRNPGRHTCRQPFGLSLYATIEQQGFRTLNHRSQHGRGLDQHFRLCPAQKNPESSCSAKAS